MDDIMLWAFADREERIRAIIRSLIADPSQDPAKVCDECGLPMSDLDYDECRRIEREVNEAYGM